MDAETIKGLKQAENRLALPLVAPELIDDSEFELSDTDIRLGLIRLVGEMSLSGDTLVLNEIDPETKQPTGRSLRRKVGYVGRTKEFDFWAKDEIEQYGYQIISLLGEDKE